MAADVPEVEDRARRWGTVYEYAHILGLAFILVFGFIRPFVLEPFKIPSGSMEDTLLIGDRVVVVKFLYGVRLPRTTRRLFAFSAPRRGDVFVFTPKHDYQEHFIKRITAVGGDSISTRGNSLRLNGDRVVGESFVKEDGAAALRDFPPFQLPLAPYFVEEADVMGHFEGLTAHVEVDVQVRQGRPVAFTLEGEPTFVIQLAERVRERTPGVPVRSYYEVQVVSDRGSGRGILYQNANTDVWYLIRPLTPTEYEASDANGGGFTVPEDHLFAMGDNRGRSLDSRGWGPVPLDAVSGRAVLIYWSMDPDPAIPVWRLHRKVRFGRIGDRVKSQYGDTEPDEASGGG